MTVVSDKIARAFNRTQLTQALALGISKPFDRVYGITDLMEFQVCIRPFFSFLGPTLLLLYIYDLPDEVICNIAVCMLMILPSTLFVIRLLACDKN